MQALHARTLGCADSSQSLHNEHTYIHECMFALLQVCTCIKYNVIHGIYNSCQLWRHSSFVALGTFSGVSPEVNGHESRNFRLPEVKLFHPGTVTTSLRKVHSIRCEVAKLWVLVRKHFCTARTALCDCGLRSKKVRYNAICELNVSKDEHTVVTHYTRCVGVGVCNVTCL